MAQTDTTEPVNPNQSANRTDLSAHAWDLHWQQGHTPWDLKGATPALIDWARENDAQLRGRQVLVPGCGLGHDAHFLAKQGASVTAVDFSASALQAARQTYGDKVQWLEADVLKLPFSQRFDLVWEYTCLCALQPSKRRLYLEQVAGALKPNGLFFGLTFNEVPGPDNAPPFATAPQELEHMLTELFAEVKLVSPAENSIKPRRGREIRFAAGNPR